MCFYLRKPFPRRRPATTPFSPPSLNRMKRHQPRRWVLHHYLHHVQYHRHHHLQYHLHHNPLLHVDQASLFVCLFVCCALYPSMTRLGNSSSSNTSSFPSRELSPNVQARSLQESCQCVSQRSNLMRERKSNCCHPLHSSALMITPSQPMSWEFLSPTKTLQSTSFSVGREVEHDRLRKDASVDWDDRACAPISLRHQAKIPQLVACLSIHLLPSPWRPQVSLRIGFEPVSCHSPSNTWEWTRERVWWSERTSSTSRPVCKSQGEAIWGPKIVWRDPGGPKIWSE